MTPLKQQLTNEELFNNSPFHCAALRRQCDPNKYNSPQNSEKSPPILFHQKLMKMQEIVASIAVKNSKSNTNIFGNFKTGTFFKKLTTAQNIKKPLKTLILCLLNSIYFY